MSPAIARVADSIRCDASGSCVVFALEVAKLLAEGARIVEGLVRFAGSIPFAHVWVETNGGKIDPTLKQFSFFALESVEYIPIRGYSPPDFLVTIEKHPEFSRFALLKKL